MNQKKLWKKFNSVNFFKDLQIPDDWDSLEDFVEWYIESKMPLMIPWNASVIRSDDAAAVCIFKKGQYQVEFYLEYPEMYIRKHAHPNMEVITMDLGGGGLAPPHPNETVSRVWGDATEKLPAGNFHGGDSSSLLSSGFITLAFQRWDNPDEMTSAAIQWKGELQGPIQAELITKHYPDALIKSNYADVSNRD
jgi:hypothetical protein